MRLYAKFLAILIPCFLCLAGIGLWYEHRTATSVNTDDLTQRIGALTGRVATAMVRHNAVDNPSLANDLLAPLGHEPSVVCAEYTSALRLIASYPRGLGCRNAQFDQVTDVELGEGVSLRIAMTESLIKGAVGRQLQQSTLTFLGTLLLAVISASIGFRLIVGRRLERLNRAMTVSTETRKRQSLDDDSSDEIGRIVATYNQLICAENQLEEKLRRTNLQLNESSQRDPLTGLYNRLFAQRNLDPLPNPTPPETGFIALLDIDHFKRVNDTHGHEAGDTVLKAVANRLNACVRDDAVVIRWGGEEFLIAFPNVNPEIGPMLASRLLNSIRQNPIALEDGEALSITASLGFVPCCLSPERDLKTAVEWADRALYLAKGNGRDRACVLWNDRDSDGELLNAQLTNGDITWVSGAAIDRRDDRNPSDRPLSA